MGEPAPQVGVIMGSQSDWPTMAHAVQILEELGIAHEVQIVSAHRTPDRLVAYAKSAAERGLKAIIAGAGGAAHLPGMVASMTRVPVLGVPVQSAALSGVDSPSRPARRVRPTPASSPRRCSRTRMRVSRIS